MKHALQLTVTCLVASSMLASCHDGERGLKRSAASARASASGSATAPSARTQAEPTPPRPWLHGRTATPAPPADARSVIARIQSSLERTAAGLPPGARSEPPADALELLVDAYAAFLAGAANADALIEKVDSLARARFLARAEALEKEGSVDPAAAAGSPKVYLHALDRARTAAGAGTTGAGLRLAVAVRRVDAALLLEAVRYFSLDPDLLFTRQQTPFWGMGNLPLSGVWLKLPCRTLIGRRAAFEFAVARLGKTAGALFGCPAPKGRELDLRLFERILNDETRSAVERITETPAKKPSPSEKERTPPPLPWNRWVADTFMAQNPDAAERALCAPAGGLGKLDCALFLHAFRAASAARDERIRRLMADVDTASRKTEDEGWLAQFKPVPYDGSDESLVPSVQLASSTGAVNSHSAFYAIPCAILERRPALLAASESVIGGNLGNFTPRSGCRWGRGSVAGFPARELEAYRDLSEQADGNFYLNHQGTMRFLLAGHQGDAIDTLMLNPRAALAKPAPPRMKPYETWSLMSAVNRATFERLAAIADPLREKLVRYYEQKGFSTEEARAASEHALFESVWGAGCGGPAQAPTLRRLLIERAPVDGVRAFIAAREHRKTERFAPLVRCAGSVGMDPLLHVAVTHPDALPLVWRLGTSLPLAEAEALDLVMEPNLPNGFGKTPLMVAAQFDQEASVRFLLEHGADPNARTWKHDEPQLGHDARTALMYAAAGGSLATIRLLLNAGADIHAADTKGAKALDYLVGRGPLAANEKLSPSEFGEAVRWLF